MSNPSSCEVKLAVLSQIWRMSLFANFICALEHVDVGEDGVNPDARRKPELALHKTS